MEITVNETTYKEIKFRKRTLRTAKYLHLTVTLTKDEWEAAYPKKKYINDGTVPIVVEIVKGQVAAYIGQRTIAFFEAMNDVQLTFIYNFVRSVFKAKKKVPKPKTINLFGGDDDAKRTGKRKDRATYRW